MEFLTLVKHRNRRQTCRLHFLKIVVRTLCSDLNVLGCLRPSKITWNNIKVDDGMKVLTILLDERNVVLDLDFLAASPRSKGPRVQHELYIDRLQTLSSHLGSMYSNSFHICNPESAISTNFMNSALASGSFRKSPDRCEVYVTVPDFWTPRISMHI